MARGKLEVVGRVLPKIAEFHRGEDRRYVLCLRLGQPDARRFRIHITTFYTGGKCRRRSIWARRNSPLIQEMLSLLPENWERD